MFIYCVCLICVFYVICVSVYVCIIVIVFVEMLIRFVFFVVVNVIYNISIYINEIKKYIKMNLIWGFKMFWNKIKLESLKKNYKF